MIYLDHHAGTPVTPAVCDAMTAGGAWGWANPQSVHAAGRAARAALEAARRQVAASIGAKPADVIFTSGGTEACNLALFGFLPCERAEGVSIVTTPIEHPALGAGLRRLERAGARIRYLEVPGGRAPSAREFGAALDGGATLAVVQWVNHETGTLLPIEAYAHEAALRAVPLLVDACQAYGRLDIDVETLGASALMLAGSKIGGPKGTGAVWVARGWELTPVLFGSSQERGRRPGTPDVVHLAGFGQAAAGISARVRAMEGVARLRSRLEQGALSLGAVRNGGGEPRVASVTNLSIPNWRGDHLVAALDLEGVCASTGAACSSGVGTPSPVLRAMYPHEPWRAESALRLSLGPETTDADVDGALRALERVLARHVAR